MALFYMFSHFMKIVSSFTYPFATHFSYNLVLSLHVLTPFYLFFCWWTFWPFPVCCFLLLQIALPKSLILASSVVCWEFLPRTQGGLDLLAHRNAYLHFPDVPSLLSTRVIPVYTLQEQLLGS